MVGGGALPRTPLGELTGLLRPSWISDKGRRIGDGRFMGYGEREKKGIEGMRR